MIAVLVAILLAALAYWLCLVIGLPGDRGGHRCRCWCCWPV
jgi:hypothetical protein